ncbi:hypothetical protein A9Q86_05670 [Flavobacteriales bacterium 33_180_T64]|nr:hypothetical protein A9Q86_05670 [Flavobacteriales bacterium 33_180_T64]
MKKGIVLYMLLTSVCAMAQYKGGNGDGFSILYSSNLTLSGTSFVFNGGIGDGFSVEEKTSILFSGSEITFYNGGNGDGFSNTLSVSNTLAGEIATALYNGSNGDGFDVSTKPSLGLGGQDLSTMYTSVNGDGFAISSIYGGLLNGTSITNLYSGGNGDGFAVLLDYGKLLSGQSLTNLYSGGNGDGFSMRYAPKNHLNYQVKFNIKVLLQGPMLTQQTVGLMNENLRANSMLPVISPYPDGVTINSSVFNQGGVTGLGINTDDIVDWIWIELRDATDNTTIIKSMSALLQRDGDVVAIDGISNLSAEVVLGDYYLVANHRNHLGVMTQNPITLSVTPTTIDFIDSNFPTFSSNAQIQLASGSMALWAGDANNSGQIKFSGSFNDSNSIKDLVLGDPLNGFNSVTFPSSGYLLQDINLDGLAKFSGSGNDSNFIKDNIFIHPSNGFGSPTFTIQSTVPPEN